jgi:hypothetical protein
MEQLKDRILREGKNLGGGILKVDGFINHQVDPVLMDVCGQEFARRFSNTGATKVLTAEISGIAPALTTARHMGLPVVYARKHKPITMPDQVFLTLTPSPHQRPHCGTDHLTRISGRGRTGVNHRRFPGDRCDHPWSGATSANRRGKDRGYWRSD